MFKVTLRLLNTWSYNHAWQPQRQTCWWGQHILLCTHHLVECTDSVNMESGLDTDNCPWCQPPAMVSGPEVSDHDRSRWSWGWCQDDADQTLTWGHETDHDQWSTTHETESLLWHWSAELWWSWEPGPWSHTSVCHTVSVSGTGDRWCRPGWDPPYCQAGVFQWFQRTKGQYLRVRHKSD